MHVLFEPWFFLSVQNGMGTSMRNLEWHISKSYFCNGISPNGESCNDIDPINPSEIFTEMS
jgi:hypothetical protein